MAAVLSQSTTGSPATHVVENARQTGPDGVLLRNSCESCATSKVKCTGRKPTCQRCEKRGFNCEYLVAKRAGRKPTGSSSSNSSAETSSSGQNGSRSSEATDTSPKGPSSTESSDFWRDLGPLMTSSGMTGIRHTDENNQNVVTPSLPPDFFTFDLPKADDLSSAPFNDSAVTGFDGFPDPACNANGALSDLLALPLPIAGGPITSPSPAREVHNFQEAPASGQTCSCLVQALGLMTQLSQLLSTASTVWTAQDLDDASAIRTVQDVLRQNKAAVDAMGMMLHCPCVHDGYLLIVMSLISLKILGSFAAVVLKTPDCQEKGHVSRSRQMSISSGPSNRNAAALGSYHLIEGTDWARMSAQAVLSELHSVRRVVKWISSKLQEEARTQGADEESSPGTTLQSEVRLSLSGDIFIQLDADLNARLKVLFKRIIDRLRTF